MRLPTRSSLLLGGCIAMAAIAACDRVTLSRDQARDQAAPAPTAPSQTPTAKSPTPAAPGASVVQLPSGRTIADVAAQVTPSVVNVFSERQVNRPEMSPFSQDPFFHYFFDLPGRDERGAQRAPQRERSLGSGVIVASDGVIMTNNHVVANADTVRVALKDGRELDAKVVGTDPQSDIAVLRVNAKQLPAIQIADSSRSRIGDLVLAIGNPFGLGQTVTMGIISATGRANVGITDYEDFIQTDAAINPGNSGGALVDMDGKLVGINTAIASRTGGYQGIGFAIPSSMAMQVENAILHGGKVTRGWLGVAIQDVTPDLAKQMDLTARHGVLVSDVTRDSPAAKAGLQRGDVVVSVDGASINDSAHLRNAIALAGKGKQLSLQIERHGKPMTVPVTLGETPAGQGGQGGSTIVDDGILSGLAVQPLDRALRGQLHVPADVDGVVVTKLDRRGPMAATGLREGDVIVEVNRKPVTSVDAFRDAARSATDSALLLVYRDGATIYLSLSK
ncbi:MAG: DegQ family serine endoprotease [Deltaproteobacteria bacterium]|nr:MAG: DegQ family serine endoprotease [Deltaproteobacteria bacterium]